MLTQASHAQEYAPTHLLRNCFSQANAPAEGTEGTHRARTRQELSQLPVRQYLDQTVVPLLLEGMTKIGKER